MAQDNLTWSTGGGLTTHTGWDLLNLASGLEEGIDMFCQVIAIANRRHFLRSVRHNTTFSMRQEAGIIHETTTSDQCMDWSVNPPARIRQWQSHDNISHHRDRDLPVPGTAARGKC